MPTLPVDSMDLKVPLGIAATKKKLDDSSAWIFDPQNDYLFHLSTLSLSQTLQLVSIITFR